MKEGDWEHWRGGGMKHDLVPVRNPGALTVRHLLTPAQFGDLAGVPPELEWLARSRAAPPPISQATS